MNQTRNERKQRAQELVWIALVTAFLFGVFALGRALGCCWRRWHDVYAGGAG